MTSRTNTPRWQNQLELSHESGGRPLVSSDKSRARLRFQLPRARPATIRGTASALRPVPAPSVTTVASIWPGVQVIPRSSKAWSTLARMVSRDVPGSGRACASTARVASRRSARSRCRAARRATSAATPGQLHRSAHADSSTYSSAASAQCAWHVQPHSTTVISHRRPLTPVLSPRIPRGRCPHASWSAFRHWPEIGGTRGVVTPPASPRL